MKHPNCRRTVYDEDFLLSPEMEKMGQQAAAKILLMDSSKKIIVPTKEEWVGFNLLEVNSDLPKRK